MLELSNSNPQLALALNSHWLRENLPKYLWHANESSLALIDVEVKHVWDSKKRVTVLYDLQLNGDGHPATQQQYVGYLVSGERLEKEYRSVLKKAKAQPPFGPAATLVPEANLILMAFPNDRKMSLLSKETLHVWLSAHLDEVANGALAGGRGQVEETKVETLRYVPDKRFTARCRVRLKTEHGDQKEISFIAKQLSDDKKAKRLYRNILSLPRAWAGDRTSLRVRLPQALAWDENSAVIFLEDLPGENLASAISTVDLEKTMAAVGELLAHFHHAQKRVRKRVSCKSELKESRSAARAIGKAFPDLRRRLRELCNAQREIRWDDHQPVVLLHGSFRLNHLFIHHGELALLDLESLRMGHPAYDIANFLASLYYFEAQERMTAAQRQLIARYFLEGYAAKAPEPVVPRAVLWSLASLLINKQAAKYIAHFHEDRAAKAQRMLALAEAMTACCRHIPNDLPLAELWKCL
jgi:thiamine kinase-like enzyme